MTEPLLCDLSVPGRVGFRYPKPDVPLEPLPEGFVRTDLPMPELSELDVIRHFTRLSQLNHSIDTGFYPLGSCTMKYNPKVNEEAARLPGFAHVHPLQPVETVQGSLLLMYELQEWLKEIGGFAGATLQPAAGAHGELTGVLIIRAYHQVTRRQQARQDPDPQLGARHQPRHLGDDRAARGGDQIRRPGQRGPGSAARLNATRRWQG